MFKNFNWIFFKYDINFLFNSILFEIFFIVESSISNRHAITVFLLNARNEFSHILLQLLKKGVNINGAMDIIKNPALNNSIFLFKRSEHDAL